MIKKTPDYEVCSSTEVKHENPERCLFAAVLWRAKWDLYPNVDRVDMRSAVRWFDEVFRKKDRYVYRSDTNITFSQTIEVLELNSSELKYLEQEVIKARTYLERSAYESESERKESRKRAGSFFERTRFRFGTKN